MFRNQITNLLCLILISGTASAESLTDQIVKGMSVQNDSKYQEVLKNFLVDQADYCASWETALLKKNKNLVEACAMFPLSQIYYKRLEMLQDAQKSGIQMSEILESSPDMWTPALPAGAWESVPFVDADGAETATEILASRVGIEKAMLAHAQHIHEQSKNPFSTFASFSIPNMVASFSGYSMAARILTYAKVSDCGPARSVATLGCKESRNFLAAAQQEVLSSIGTEDFVAQLEKLNSKNSSQASLKAHQVLKAVAAIQKLRDEASPTQIMDSLKTDRKHPAFLELQQAITEISESPLSNPDIHRMLLAVSILAEIRHLQQDVHGLSASPNVSSLGMSSAIAEQMYELKSWVTKALIEEEQVQ